MGLDLHAETRLGRQTAGKKVNKTGEHGKICTETIKTAYRMCLIRNRKLFNIARLVYTWLANQLLSSILGCSGSVEMRNTDMLIAIGNDHCG